MFEQKVEKTSEFFWQSQFKFYYQDEVIFAKMVNAKLNYGYEFSSIITISGCLQPAGNNAFNGPLLANDHICVLQPDGGQPGGSGRYW